MILFEESLRAYSFLVFFPIDKVDCGDCPDRFVYRVGNFAREQVVRYTNHHYVGGSPCVFHCEVDLLLVTPIESFPEVTIIGRIRLDECMECQLDSYQCLLDLCKTELGKLQLCRNSN